MEILVIREAGVGARSIREPMIRIFHNYTRPEKRNYVLQVRQNKNGESVYVFLHSAKGKR